MFPAVRKQRLNIAKVMAKCPYPDFGRGNCFLRTRIMKAKVQGRICQYEPWQDLFLRSPTGFPPLQTPAAFSRSRTARWKKAETTKIWLLQMVFIIACGRIIAQPGTLGPESAVRLHSDGICRIQMRIHRKFCFWTCNAWTVTTYQTAASWKVQVKINEQHNV